MNNRILFQVVKYLLAIPMLIFGLNKFLLFASFPPPEGELAQAFMGAMFTTYLAKFVGAVEILGGILLLIPRTAFLGFLILLPVVANITLYHFAHDMPGNGIWIFTLVTTMFAAYFFKDQFSQLTKTTP